MNADHYRSFLGVDGRSWAFDSRANGYGRGDGVATIIVKRLSQALKDGDPIRAIVRETALNQDGKTESITSPSQAAQAAMMKECYAKAGLDPADTHYFEAHGTGTPTGDLIETGAMATMFKPGRPADQPLLIGSAKSNIGHAETTSGLAGIIKVIMAMENNIIPASINVKELNPNIPFDDWRLKVVTEPTPWPIRHGEPKRASINNFGYGGSNAHVILECADGWKLPVAKASPVESNDGAMGLMMLSAKNEGACKKMLANLSQYLNDRLDTENPQELLESIVYTLGQRRSLFTWVLAQPVPLTSGIAAAVKSLSGPTLAPGRASRQPRLGFVFTGQGAQHASMARELLEAYPVFRATIDAAEKHLKVLGADWSLLEELLRDAGSSRVNDTSVSIPICVAVQIALVDLLRSWGITPTAVTSHSSGEVAAAYVVGALDLRSSMAVAYYRADLTARHNATQTVKGGMIAVGVSVDETEEYLAKLDGVGKAVAACINSPTSVTVAGDVSAVEAIEAMMKADGVFARRLRVDAAYHSHHMEPIADGYESAMEKQQISGPVEGALDTIAYWSPVTGDRIFDASEIADPAHWVASMVQPVQFVDSFTGMILGDSDAAGSSVDAIIEIGPHTALGSAMKEIMGLPLFNGVQVPYFGSLVRNTDARLSLQALAGALAGRGQPLNVEAINFPKGLPANASVMTDLPQYPWVHETRHWQENRLNATFRQRTEAPHDLIGSVAVWANPSTPLWRNILKLNDHPWIRDHVVDSSIIYPGAGFICLAIEALAQFSRTQGNDAPIAGFRLREVDLQAALVVPDGIDGVEVQTILSPADDKALAYKDWKKFEIVSVTTAGVWTHHAQGMVYAEYDTTPVAKASEMPGRTRSYAPEEFYGNLRRVGIKHGPAFQHITSIERSRLLSESMSEITVPDAAKMDSWPANCVIQPAVLDTIVQAAYTALPRAGAQMDSPMVPRSVQSMWIKNETAPQDRLEVRTKLIRADAQTFRANVYAGGNADMVVQMENITFQSLGAAASLDTGKPWESMLTSRLDWVADPTLVSPATLEVTRKEMDHESDPVENQMVEDLRRACVYFAQDVLKELPASIKPDLEWFLQKYYAWLIDTVEQADAGKLGPTSSTWTQDSDAERSRHIEKVRNASVNGEMVCHLGPHLGPLMRGETAPLELMMEDRLLTKYYRNILKWHRSFEDAAGMLRGIVQHNPQARVLEIGGGTGGGTHYMLDVIGTPTTGGPLASAYHFTDVSSGFFEAASKEFAEWADIMQYTKLDIEKDPVAQGFEFGSYDVIVACQVLHATQSMRQTMTNVRKLLKPGGKLLLVETTQDQLDVQFVFGLVSGWWLSEEPERQVSPNLTVPLWDQVLKDTGFTGCELEIPDSNDKASYAISAIQSTVRLRQEPKLPSAAQCVIVTSERNPCPESWLSALQLALSEDNSDVVVPTAVLETATRDVFAGKTCIFVGEAGEGTILSDLAASELKGLQSMTTACQGLLWVTRGGAVDCESPAHSLAAGFLRTLRNEYVGRALVTLDLDPATAPWAESGVASVAQVLTANFGEQATANLSIDALMEYEYAVRKGAVQVPRIFQDATRNKAISPDLNAEPVMESTLLVQDSRPLELQVGTPGMLNTLAFADDERPCWEAETIAADMVKISPKAYGVNFRDVMVAMGQLDERTMGLECSGVITEVGSEAAAQGLAVGDSVMCLLDGPFASHVCVRWPRVAQIPAGMTFEDAASIPLVFSTVYYSLYDKAQLQKGQSILIHAAAGGVGQAAIILAQHLGADIYATVGSAEKKRLLMKRYGIPEDRVFSSRSISFAQDVKNATNNHGVDVVLNSLSGPLLQASFDVLAPFGHFVELGKSDIERNNNLSMDTFSRQASFSSVDLLSMLRLREDLCCRVLRDVARLTVANIIKPVAPITVYPMAEIAQAFRLLQTGKHSGKVVLSIDSQAVVQTVAQQQRVRLSANASYLLVGGVGGVGSSIARWLIQHGAKNLIVLSRSAGKPEATAEIAEQVQSSGVRLMAVSCDVSDASALASALQQCQDEGMPAVRGIVQGAMVLKVSCAST